MTVLVTTAVVLAALVITMQLFRRAPRQTSRLLLGCGLLETLWFAVALARINQRLWHNPPAILRALSPLLLLDAVALLASWRRPSPAPTSTSRLLLATWICMRVLIPSALYLALSQDL